MRPPSGASCTWRRRRRRSPRLSRPVEKKNQNKHSSTLTTFFFSPLLFSLIFLYSVRFKIVRFCVRSHIASSRRIAAPPWPRTLPVSLSLLFSVCLTLYFFDFIFRLLWFFFVSGITHLTRCKGEQVSLRRVESEETWLAARCGCFIVRVVDHSFGIVSVITFIFVC